MISPEKPDTYSITQFVCGRCKRPFDKKADADTHCICKCGRIVEAEERFGYGTNDKCEKCRTKGFLMEAHARVKRLKNDLASAEANRDDLKTKYASLLKPGDKY